MKKKQKFNDEEVIKLYYDIYILLGYKFTYEEFKDKYLKESREVV